MSQTVVQHPETIRFGSARLEIGPDLENMVDVGALTGVKFTHELGTKSTISSDNAGVVLEKVSGQTAAVEANLMEINLDILAQYLGGISKLEYTEGTPVEIVDEQHTLKGVKFVRLANRNGDGESVTGISVKSSAGDAAEEGVDYHVAVDTDGYTCIARVESSLVITEGDVVEVTYSYVPPRRKSLHVGGLQKLEASVARLTNYNDARQAFSITVYKATADTGIAIEFKADDAEETDVVPIKLLGTEDQSRNVGDQLFVIDDEQF